MMALQLLSLTQYRLTHTAGTLFVLFDTQNLTDKKLERIYAFLSLYQIFGFGVERLQ